MSNRQPAFSQRERVRAREGGRDGNLKDRNLQKADPRERDIENKEQGNESFFRPCDRDAIIVRIGDIGWLIDKTVYIVHVTLLNRTRYARFGRRTRSLRTSTVRLLQNQFLHEPSLLEGRDYVEYA